MFSDRPGFTGGTERQELLTGVLREVFRETPKVTPAIRTVFVLRDIEELSAKETAEAPGISVPVLRSRLLLVPYEIV